MNYGHIARGSNVFDPEHVSYETGMAEAAEGQRISDYRKSRDSYLKTHPVTHTPDHPTLHGGHRTREDIQKEIDYGHTVISSQKPHERKKYNETTGRHSNIWQDSNLSSLHNLYHGEAEKIGYDANKHKYIEKERKATKQAAFEKELSERPKPNLWDDNVDHRGNAVSAFSEMDKPKKAPSIWDDEPTGAPATTAAPAKKKTGLIGRLRKK